MNRPSPSRRSLQSLLALGAVGTLLAACQPDAPIIQAKPEDPPDPVDTDEAVPLAQPDIEVEPANLGFGQRPPNCPSEAKTVTIRNVGNRKLDISKLEIRGQHAGSYTITSNLPTTIRAGQETTIDVVFESAQVDVTYDLARVFIESNDPDEGEVTVPLDGTGSLAVMNEEEFLQQNASGVDVLWVLDNSGSMSDSINGLKNAMSTFVQSMVNLGLDYRLAITTTFEVDGSEDATGAPGADGEFVDLWIDGATLSQADVVAEFTKQANIVANSVGDFSSVGADDEEGFDASHKALTAPRINQSPNSGFLRPDATLAIAVLSDEDDASDDIGVNAYVSWLAGLKGGDMSKVSFSGMVPASGPDYKSAISQTGGIYSPIGQFDINPFLTFLSFVAAGLEIHFELDEEPLSYTAQAITVQVCDPSGQCQNVPYSAIDGWTFNPTTNSVEMNGSYIPEPGESVVVLYPIDSDCPT